MTAKQAKMEALLIACQSIEAAQCSGLDHLSDADHRKVHKELGRLGQRLFARWENALARAEALKG